MVHAVSAKVFRGPNGSETHLTIEPDGAGDLAAQLAEVEVLYRQALRGLDLSPGSAVFRRLLVSDVINQAPVIKASPLWHDDAAGPVAVSLVQQPPFGGRKIALIACHVDGPVPLEKIQVSPHSVRIQGSGQRHLWTTGLVAGEAGPNADSHAQTEAVFASLLADLEGQGGRLRANCLRTWFYLKNVDTYYAGLVEARREIFAAEGMGGNSPTIASTGIEGASSGRYDVVALDAYANLDVTPEQIRYLNDFERLCPTRDYHVHFERATRVAYDDRAHIFLSGTASIDRRGAVVHEGDVLRQFDRAVENVEALLADGGAALNDLMHLIVYLRDPADHATIAAALEQRLPDVPAVIVQGAVCRPQWLIELEGIAITPNHEPHLPRY